MHTLLASSSMSRVAGAVFAAWLCGMGPAGAGTAGGDVDFQGALAVVCNHVGVTSCPQVPTITQAILAISGFENAAPDFVRGPQGSFATPDFNFGGLCSVSSGNPKLPAVCSQANAINAVNPPAASPVDVSDLPNLTPLAFATGKGLPAVPVPLGTSNATSYFYAVATPDQSGEITRLTIFFDSPTQTNSSIQKSVFAKISLPLKVLNNDGSERLICGATPCPIPTMTTTPPTTLATLQLSGCSSGQNCVNGVAANVIGDFSTPGTIGNMSASQLNIGVNVFFLPSPNSASSHLILRVEAPMLVTHGNDPAHFGVVPSGVIPVNGLSGLPTAFTSDVVPASTKIGITPQAAPTCNGTCPTQHPPFISTYPFCASFAGGVSGPLGSGQFQSTVATFASISTDATTYLSSPVPAALVGSSIQCPF